MKKNLIIGIVIILLIYSLGVYAIELCNARDIEYNASDSNWQVDTVEEALNDLYENKTDYAVAKVYSHYIKQPEMFSYDETSDHNLRYIGNNPDNYIEFNGELWRIIGIMNNVVDENENNSPKLKIIRDSIGEYSWDNKSAGTGTSDSSSGSNDWTDSTLMKILNEGPYWNRTIGECPKGSENKKEECDFSTTGLTEEAKKKISKVKWNIGGYNDYKATSLTFYEAERGNTVYPRKPLHTTWTGNIALLYPSDYGYAVDKSLRNSCLTDTLYQYGYNKKECSDNNWLYLSQDEWTLTPRTENSYTTFYIYRNGAMSDAFTTVYCAIRPALYLKSDVLIVNGEGTKENPFKIK